MAECSAMAGLFVWMPFDLRSLQQFRDQVGSSAVPIAPADEGLVLGARHGVPASVNAIENHPWTSVLTILGTFQIAGGFAGGQAGEGRFGGDAVALGEVGCDMFER